MLKWLPYYSEIKVLTLKVHENILIIPSFIAVIVTNTKTFSFQYSQALKMLKKTIKVF